jgi:primosomal protein N''
VTRRLYVNGCSVSYGYGLDPALTEQIDQVESKTIVHNRYGALVADRVGLQEMNRSRRAGSNDRIVRTTVRDLSAHQSEIAFCLIGITSPFRSEIRFNERYVRMFFDQGAFGTGLTEGFEFCNRFFFEVDASRNEFLARDYLSHCNSVIRYGYDEAFLAERLLTQVLLLQGLFRSLRVGWLFVPVLEMRFSRKTLKQFEDLIAAVEKTRFLRLSEALEEGWSLVAECEAQGLELFKGHPLQDGHELIAGKIVAAIESADLANKKG